MHLKAIKLVTCPNCSNPNSLRNSRARTSLEKLIKAFTWYDLYRCNSCGWRGYKSGFRLTVKLIKKILLYIILMLLSAFIVAQILKRLS
ncbi:MAG TPA: hypothetical protein VH917_02905 [Ignavibacteriaceae bacterium]